MLIENLFKDTPAHLFQLKERDMGSYQLIAPLFHDDGDMMAIYIEDIDDKRVKICDRGMSLMRLSYTFDLDTDKKRRILDDMILSKGAQNDSGNIVMIAEKERVYPAIMSFSNLVSKIGSMDMLSREIVTELFYENLNDAMTEVMLDIPYEPNYVVPSSPDYIIDFAFMNSKGKPIYLFGIKDTNKAQQTTITCLQLAKRQVQFKSIVVFNDLDGLSKFARYNILNTVGKAFSDMEGFLEGGKEYIIGEMAS